MGAGFHPPQTQMMPVCLVTGSSGKLGSALCRALTQTHQIAAVYRKKLPQFPSQLRSLIDIDGSSESGESASVPFCVQGDLTCREDVRRIVEVVLARFGQIDVLINSAADTRYHGSLLELSFDSTKVEQQLITNCIAPIRLASAIFQELWKDERDANREFNRCVINVSSISGLHVYPSIGQAFYSASKTALNFLTLHLSCELADYSVRANSICPSRFPDSVPTDKVVSRVRDLIESHLTGQVVEVTSDSETTGSRMAGAISGFDIKG
jgi:NAD(P)-dependent dehydrogenase (short-subunit alcohol dehydrogenase family)